MHIDGANIPRVGIRRHEAIPINVPSDEVFLHETSLVETLILLADATKSETAPTWLAGPPPRALAPVAMPAVFL